MFDPYKLTKDNTYDELFEALHRVIDEFEREIRESIK